jgi:hypothetical protein
VGTIPIAAAPLPGIKKDLLLSKRSRPFLVTFSGEAEKVTARRVGVLAVNRKAAKSQFQTPHPHQTENFSFPPIDFCSKEPQQRVKPNPPEKKRKKSC